MVNLGNIEAVALDFDGLLMDSERIWHEVEQKTLREHGIIITQEESHKTSGLRCSEVIEFWIEEKSESRYSFKSLNPIEIEEIIEARVADEISKRGNPKPGAVRLLSWLIENDKKFAVVSSSPKNVIQTGLDKMGFRDSEIQIFTAKDESFGKPHPAVYLSFLEHFEIPPQRVVAFEDSLNGSIAAKAAKLNLISVPEEHNDKTNFLFADIVLKTLEGFDLDALR